ncbi:RNA 2',3'-cyclic phosphodiesterase [Actinocorallia aurea]
MRLFAAIHPPTTALDALALAVAGPRSAHPGLPWTDRDQWHLTLAFYGDADAETADALADLLAETVRSRPAPRLGLARSGTFPEGVPERAEVLWAGVDGDLAVLAELVGRCAEAGRRVGLAVPSRVFTPHLTVVRNHEPRDLRAPAAGLAAFEGSPWTPAGLDLMRGNTPQPGYTRLRTFPFAHA